MLEVTKMAISKKLLTVLAGLVLMTVLLLQCDLDAQAANHNYLSDYTGGAAAVLDARSTNTSKVLNATAKELNLDLDSLSREEESTLVMANVTSALNVRTEPATDAEKAGKLYKDCGGKILERKDGWTKIQWRLNRLGQRRISSLRGGCGKSGSGCGCHGSPYRRRSDGQNEARYGCRYLRRASQGR